MRSLSCKTRQRLPITLKELQRTTRKEQVQSTLRCEPGGCFRLVRLECSPLKLLLRAKQVATCDDQRSLASGVLGGGYFAHSSQQAPMSPLLLKWYGSLVGDYPPTNYPPAACFQRSWKPPFDRDSCDERVPLEIFSFPSICQVLPTERFQQATDVPAGRAPDITVWLVRIVACHDLTGPQHATEIFSPYQFEWRHPAHSSFGWHLSSRPREVPILQRPSKLEVSEIPTERWGSP